MKHLSCLGLVLCCTLAATAQQRPFNWKAAYYGETATHYGLKIGGEWQLAERTLTRKPVSKRWLAGAALAAYRHPHHHIGVLVSPEITWLRTGRRGGTFEWGASPAVMRYFLQGKTYTPTADGRLERVRGAGRWVFLPTLAIGLGHDYRVRRDWPVAWYIRLNLMAQIPYNASWLPRFALEAGVRYRPQQ